MLCIHRALETNHHGIVSLSQRVNAPVGLSGPSSATRTASRAPARFCQTTIRLGSATTNTWAGNAEDSQFNVYAGEREVRPPCAPSKRSRAGPSAAGQPGVLFLQLCLHLAGGYWVACRGMQGSRDAGGVAGGQCCAHDSQRTAGVLVAVGSAPSRVQVGGVDADQ